MIQMKKKTVSICWGCMLFMLGSIVYLQAQDTARKIGDNPLTIEQTAVLDLESTTKGFLLPRMTEAQRDAITNPANGLIVFNTSNQSVDFYDAPTTSWKQLSGGSTAVTSPLLESSFTTPYNFQIKMTNQDSKSISPNFVIDDITFTGAAGATITAVDVASATINAFGRQTVNYTVSYGTASATAAETNIKATYSYAGVTTSATLTSTTDLLHRGIYYDVVAGQNSTTWLDRNLGATKVATSSTDAAAYGDLYQWGRGTDGHQLRDSGTTATNATNNTPGHDDFIIETSSPYDWRDPQENSLWQGVSGTNNPCPSGFRVPTETEFNRERLAFGTNNLAGAFGSALKIPAGGYRSNNNGIISNVGTNGYYSTSTISSVNVRFFFISGTDTYTGETYRSEGLSVRCIKN